jgi:hypothetical protein
MMQIPANKRADVINLYVSGLPKEQVLAGANVTPEEMDAVVTEFLGSARRLFELEQKTGKTCDEIVAEVEELSQQREKLISDLTDMECM